MNVLQQLQEQYIQEFSNNVPLGEFLLNVFITAALALALRWFYIRFGETISNRKKFANNFLPLALGTLLIIMVVKSSIALSLGLVGALSIVRFRSAIKEPEELTYLFLIIGIGLAGGANQPILALLAFSLIILILWLSKQFGQKASMKSEDKVFINISTDTEDFEKISALLSGIFDYVELKRMDTLKPGLDLSFLCKVSDIAQISRIQKEVAELSAATKLSIIDHPEW